MWTAGMLVGRYQLVGPIARGGMAELWVAQQRGPEGFQRVVALKRILATTETDPDVIHMLIDEARIAAHLAHPNIVQIIELGEHEGNFFIAMEYLNGEPLSQVMRRSHDVARPMPVNLAMWVVCEAAAGLGHAHHQRTLAGAPMEVVHRDVSPQNIMVTYDGVVKVVDFGIARAVLRSSRTKTGAVKGKAAYMSPEQAEGLRVDARSDVFSLGIVLFEVVTRSRIWGDTEEMRVLLNLVDRVPMPRARDVVPSTPPRLDLIIAKALSMNPAERFPTCKEMMAALQDYLRSMKSPVGHLELEGHMKPLFAEREEARRKMIEMAALGLPADEVSQNPFQLATPHTTKGQRAGPSPSGPAGGGLRRLAVAIAVGAVVGAAAMFAAAFMQKRSSERFVPPPIVVNMRPPPEPPKAVEPEPAPPPPPEPVAPEPEPEPPAPVKRSRTPKKGLLRLETDPWTQVYLGSRLLGDTPLFDIELPAGDHMLRLVNQEEGISQRIQVSIRAGEKTAKKLKLK